MLNKKEITEALLAKGKPFKIGMKELANETGKSEWMMWKVYNGQRQAIRSAPTVDFDIVV